LGSGSSVNRKSDVAVCPICGSELVELKYRGNKPNLVALAKRDDFLRFMGCKRVDLHNKTVNGVNYRGQVFIRTILKSDGC